MSDHKSLEFSRPVWFISTKILKAGIYLIHIQSCHAHNLTTFDSDSSRLSTLVCAHVKFCVPPTLRVLHRVLHPARKSALLRQGMNWDQVESPCSALPSLPVQEQCTFGNLEVSGSRI